MQDKGADFYRSFSIVIAGLDNIKARIWLNSTLFALAEKGDDGDFDLTCVVVCLSRAPSPPLVSVHLLSCLVLSVRLVYRARPCLPPSRSIIHTTHTCVHLSHMTITQDGGAAGGRGHGGLPGPGAENHKPEPPTPFFTRRISTNHPPNQSQQRRQRPA